MGRLPEPLVTALRDTAAEWLARGIPAVVVEVVRSRGSVPRDAGTWMLVAADRTAGTIGGGHLEWQAIAHARALLAAPASRPSALDIALGPSLGQCCGGALTLGFAPLDRERLSASEAAPPRFHLQLYGAGHVGRAIARLLVALDVRVDWIDERETEFPAALGEGAWPAHIRRVAGDPVEAEVDTAPPGAYYLVLTHRHDLDLRIGEAILQRGDFGYFGLIGSKTKRERFIHRYQALGIAEETIAGMRCPIGIDGINGKEPEVIAIGVVAQLLQQR